MLFKPTYKPGINKRDTGLQHEGGYADSNMVRFKGDPLLPQPIGGWDILTVSQVAGKARGMHAWRTLESAPVLAIGTTDNLYAVVGGSLRDITPKLHDTTLEDCFTTVSGSAVVTVYLPFHRFTAGDSVSFANHQTTVGGLTIEGDYTVTEVITSGRFTITHGSNASSTVSTPGGGFVDISAPLPDGVEDAPALGYGTGSYGAGSYGSASLIPADIRTWSLDNWGEFLLANPTGYGIFEWQPETAYPDLSANGTFTGNADGWALGTGYTYSSNAISASAGTASNLSQNVEEVLEGGRTYRITFTVTRSAGSLKFRVNAGSAPAVIDVAEASSAITKSGTYSRTFICPADPVDIVFEKDASFAGTIDDVSYQLESIARRIDTAPARVDSMFVDPRGLVVALGTTQVTGEYSPTTVRNSDLANNKSWVPDTGSLASEYVLRGGGGRLMAGLATAEQSLVWGDDGVFSFQYQGTVGAAYDVVLLGTKCGLISRKTVSEQNGFVGWMANTRQFFIFRGVSNGFRGKPEVMPCPLQESVFDNLDFDQALKCHAGVNPEFNEFWFFYPDSTVGSECNRVVAVDWTTGVWVSHQMARTTWQSSGVYQEPIAVDTNGTILKHESGNTANGGLLGAWLETADFDAADGEKLLSLFGIIPDIKDQVGNIGWTIKRRLEPHAPEIVSDQYISTPSTRRVNFRHKGRQFRIRMDWLTTGGWGRIGAIRYITNQDGSGK
jgi:hypothetical protein